MEKKIIFATLKTQQMAKTSGIEGLKQQFKENKQLRMITFSVVGVLVLLIGYLLFRQLVWEPDNQKSKGAYVAGLNYAAVDSTDKAIDELQPVVKKYDGKVGGEIAQVVLARQYMTKGQFKKALSLLEEADLNDTYVSVGVIGLQGDCYSEMGNYKKALELYEEAAATNENEKTTPEYLFKAALVCEQLKDFTKATELYERIRDEFGQYAQQKVIEKYIARSKNKKVK